MNHLRTAIFTTCILIAALVVYIYYSFDESYDANRALDDFLKGHYQEAGKILAKINVAGADPNYLLDQAYVARAEKNVELSNQLLKKAESLAESPAQDKLKLEIALNQALNAYLQGDRPALQKALEQSNTILKGAQNDWTGLFQQLLTKMGNGEKPTSEDKAVKQEEYWKDINGKEPLSPWMKRAFQNVFTSQWAIVQQAESLIARGEYVQVRQILEKSLKGRDEAEKDELNYLIGLSYSREARSKPYAAATPYYKLAYGYFSRIPFQHEKYSDAKAEFVNQIANEMNILIEKGKFQDLYFYFNVLEQLDEQEIIEKFSTRLIQISEEQSDEESWDQMSILLNILNRSLPSGTAREAFQSYLDEKLEKSLETNEDSEAMKYLKAAELMSDDPTAFRAKYSEIMSGKIAQILPDDDANLTLTNKLLKLWLVIQTDPTQKVQLAEKLLERSKQLWLEPNGSAKAAALMLSAKEIVKETSGENEINALIAKDLQESYRNAKKQGDYPKLSSLYRASEELKLKDLTLVTPKEIEDDAKEANYLLVNNKFNQADEIVNWILLADPQNKKALMIAGLIHYFEGDYSKAADFLGRINGTNSETHQAYAISLILMGKEKEGLPLFEELERKEKIPAISYLRLGFGELINQHPFEAKSWFEKISTSSDEKNIGLGVAAYQMKQWQAASSNLSSISPSYSGIDGIDVIKILSLIGAGDQSRADNLLKSLLEKKVFPLPKEASQPFVLFAKDYLKAYSKYFAAADYYLTMKNDPQKALDYISMIETPTFRDLTKKAEILTKLQRMPEAQEVLVEALEKAEGEKIPSNSLNDIRIRLGEYFLKHNDPISAYLYLKDASLQSDKMNENNQRVYAELLLEVGRYDLALKQYQNIKKIGRFNDKDRLNYIIALIHTDQFEKANKEANQWLESNPYLPLLDHLKLAQQMMISNEKLIIWTLLDRIESTLTNLTIDENAELINLYIMLGDFNKAKKLVSEKSDQLTSTYGGLIALARFNEHYSKHEFALLYAKKAHLMAPEKMEPLLYLIQVEPAKELSERLAAVYKENKGKKAPNYTLLLNLVGANFRKYLIVNSIKLMASPLVKPDLLISSEILQKAEEKLSDIPLTNLLQGQLYLFSDNSLKSFTFLNKAIALNVSYTQAYKSLALLYIIEKKLAEGIETLQKGIQFAPNDAYAFVLSGEMEEKNGRLLNAIESYRNAIKYKPNFLYAYLLLSRLQLKVNNREEAKKVLEDYLKINTKSSDAFKSFLETLYFPVHSPNSEALYHQFPQQHFNPLLTH